MKEIRIPIPSSQTSKGEEYAILEKIVKSLKGTQTYLEQLFSERLLNNWFCQQVNNDSSCDLYQDYLNEIEQHHKDNAKIAKLDETLEYNRGEYEKAHKVLEDRLEKKRIVLEQNETTIASLMKRIDLLVKANNELQDQIQHMKVRERNLSQEILRFKARLFDIGEVDVSKLVLGFFTQCCQNEDGTFSHDHNSLYEDAQKYLIDLGLILPGQCKHEA